MVKKYKIYYNIGSQGSPEAGHLTKKFTWDWKRDGDGNAIN